MSRRSSRRRARISLTHLQVLYLALTALILLGAGSYVMRHQHEVASLSTNSQQQLSQTLINARTLQQRHAWLLSLLHQLSLEASRFQLEFELLVLDPERSDEIVRQVHQRLTGLRAELETDKAQSFGDRLLPLRDYLDMMLGIGYDLLLTEGGNSRLQIYRDSDQALSAINFEIGRIEASVEAETELLASRVGHTIDRVERNSERMGQLFDSIGEVLLVTLIAVFLVLAGSTSHLFLLFQQRLRALARYAEEIAVEQLVLPPFKSRDPTGRLASQMSRMARRIRRLFREARAATETAETLAYYDPLTGLENRRLFGRNLAAAFADVRRGGSSASLLMLDLDGFKAVNDTIGHDAGDQLLKIVAQRLRDTVRDGDHLARMGGDEFALLTRRDGTSLPQLPQRILKALREPIMLERHRLQISTSIGIARIGEDGESMVELLRNADMALYKAKALGRDCFHYFSEQLNEEAQHKIRMIAAMRDAIESEAFDVHFQPKVDLRRGHTCGLEALIRWPLQDGSYIRPDEFIPLAEETGLILPIGEWVLRRACEEGSRLQRDGYALPIAVNLSARQFIDEGFVARVAAILRQTQLPPALLELEITETLLLDNIERSISVLSELKAMGITVSIDDFGTGFSSLEYLKILPVDVLKLDRSFVAGLPGDCKDVAIVEAVVSLGRRLGLAVVAEGIETAEQGRYLARLHCDIGQGALFGLAQPIDELELGISHATALAAT
ncbi:putative bifunctional diguanylate cyclase/phosphodiesterase [Motiliproteus sediminis]|uniref:putative bifunctional diguanylate cyclase/phosphodiesterase n=1 Tax=Motiliproteus sediminis TaxID=1468178 RepID=UPI001AEF3706|nr:EAL domain-containing protein [Motiliproteus sediminis]